MILRSECMTTLRVDCAWAAPPPAMPITHATSRPSVRLLISASLQAGWPHGGMAGPALARTGGKRSRLCRYQPGILEHHPRALLGDHDGGRIGIARGDGGH